MGHCGCEQSMPLHPASHEHPRVLSASHSAYAPFVSSRSERHWPFPEHAAPALVIGHERYAHETPEKPGWHAHAPRTHAPTPLHDAETAWTSSKPPAPDETHAGAEGHEAAAAVTQNRSNALRRVNIPQAVRYS